MAFIRGTHYKKQGKSCEQQHHDDCWKMVLLVSFYLIQSRQFKHTLQDSVNELIIWKMNPQVIPMTIVSNSNWHSCMHKEQIENLWMDKIASKTYLSVQRNWAGRNFTTAFIMFHNSLHMQECRNEYEIYMYNYKLIQLLNHNKLINGILGDMLDQAWL